MGPRDLVFGNPTRKRGILLPVPLLRVLKFRYSLYFGPSAQHFA